MKRILVTAVGGDISQSIAMCLKDIDDIFIVGTDIHEKHAGKLFVDDFVTVPTAKNNNYIDVIRKIIKSKNIDVLIPVNENEISTLINSETNFRMVHCGRNVVNIGLDKLVTINSLISLGVDVPWTIDADKNIPEYFPCIIKPRFSSGSKLIFLINNIKEAQFFANKYPSFVFQELLDPYQKEITVCVYRTKGGDVGSVQLERLLVGGLTSWARVIKNENVQELVKFIADEWNLKGSLNIQLRLTEKGPMIFEVNPRFSSTVYMRHQLGFKDVLWSVEEFFGEKIYIKEVKTGSVLSRVQEIKILASS